MASPTLHQNKNILLGETAKIHVIENLSVSYIDAVRLLSSGVSSSASTSEAAGSLKLTLTTPFQTYFKATPVHQVNIDTSSGAMGILSSHVPTIQQLKPGVVEVMASAADAQSSKFFASGGFATMNPDSTLVIAAAEAWPLSAFVPESVARLRECTTRQLSESTTDQDRASAQIALDLLDSLSLALGVAK